MMHLGQDVLLYKKVVAFIPEERMFALMQSSLALRHLYAIILSHTAGLLSRASVE